MAEGPKPLRFAVSSVVALDIAMQSSFALALGKRIVGTREVIEPDVPIARTDKHLRRCAALRKSLLTAGQRFFRDQFLATFHPGYVGIAEQRDAVGTERERALGRVGDGRRGLMRQPVHQIEIDMDDAGLTQSVGGARGLFDALPAPDRFLHARGGNPAHRDSRGSRPYRPARRCAGGSANADRSRSRSR